MFEISIPKNPIHYIENGFEPTSAISYDPISGSTDWDSPTTRVVVTAKNTADSEIKVLS